MPPRKPTRITTYPPAIMPIQKWSEQIWIVKLADEPLLSEDLQSAEELAVKQPMAPRLVLDMAAVTYFNSSNLSQMLRLRKKLIDRHACLRLAAVPDGLWAVFLTTGLDKVFDFDKSVPDSLTHLQIVPCKKGGK